MIKTILSAASVALLLSSGAALANCRHLHHHLARADHGYQTERYYGVYQAAPRPAPQVMGDYHDPFGTYSVEPSPVSDQ
jgi:hypothetical protein